MKQRTYFKLRTIEDYTAKEIERFDKMHIVLKTYNASIGTKNELPLPKYSNAKMSEYSAYRELFIAKEGNFNSGKEEKIDFASNKFDETDWTWD